MPEPTLPTAIIVIPIVLAMLMVCLVMIKPSILKDGGGQIIGFCALFLLPISVGPMGGIIACRATSWTTGAKASTLMTTSLFPPIIFRITSYPRRDHVILAIPIRYGTEGSRPRYVVLNMYMFSISGIRRNQRILNCTNPTTTANVCSVIRAPGAMRKAGIIGKKRIC